MALHSHHVADGGDSGLLPGHCAALVAGTSFETRPFGNLLVFILSHDEILPWGGLLASTGELSALVAGTSVTKGPFGSVG